MSNTRRTTPAPRARQTKPPSATITFKGSKYKVADTIGVWPLMQFSSAAESGLTIGDPRGLAALYAMLRDVIHEDDWGRFQEDMLTSKTQDLEALMKLANDAVGVLQERQEKTPARPSPNGKAVTASADEDG